MSDVRADLVKAGEELAAANEARKRAREKVRAALEAGHDQVPLREMCRLSGISTVTAYRLLGKDIKT